MENFGKIFKYLREGKGKSLSEVAKDHLSTSQLSRFENGQSDITVSKLILVLEELNVGLDEFVYASQDFKKDELTKILEKMKKAIYDRDVVTLKQLLSEQMRKAQGGIHQEFHELNALLIKLRLADLDKEIVVHPEELLLLTDYLFQVENWGYYELLLFANSMDDLSQDSLLIFCREILRRTQFYREMKQHRTVISQILLGAYLVCIHRDRFVDALYLDKTINSLFFDETEIFERILYKYGKALYEFKKNNSTSSIMEMRKCIGLFREVESHGIADWYEKYLEKILNGDE
ncbi:TPA: helix-turn-helix domain-containing protein [Streptococcus suis]|uniref:Rgg family transcriptional regulator n=1 Tax=Streptococcus suis TaxID=1307 RepID=UPI001478EC78|nr:helix-turn-helix domain-containing protein [Streptococcus suis]